MCFQQRESYDPFTVPSSAVFRPPPSKVANLKNIDYLGKAKVVSQLTVPDGSAVSWFNIVHNCLSCNNPNTIKSYKILQKLSPKHAAQGVAQSTYPIYRHGKACLSKQPPWRAAGDPRLARGRSWVRAPGPVGTLCALFFSTLPSFLLREIILFALSPPIPQKC